MRRCLAVSMVRQRRRFSPMPRSGTVRLWRQARQKGVVSPSATSQLQASYSALMHSRRFCSGALSGFHQLVAERFDRGHLGLRRAVGEAVPTHFAGTVLEIDDVAAELALEQFHDPGLSDAAIGPGGQAAQCCPGKRYGRISPPEPTLTPRLQSRVPSNTGIWNLEHAPPYDVAIHKPAPGDNRTQQGLMDARSFFRFLAATTTHRYAWSS